jgi:hypothetical protein
MHFLLLVEFGILAMLVQLLAMSAARPLCVLAECGAVCHFWRAALLCHARDWVVK